MVMLLLLLLMMTKMMRFTIGSVGPAVAVTLLLIVDIMESKPDHQLEKGRIKAFDDMLRMYGKEINEADNLIYAIEEAKRLAHNTEYHPEYVSYYIEILELLQSTGSAKIIGDEQFRLNVIITSASNQPGSEGEMEYALIRRNILSAFTDAAAEFILHGTFTSPGDSFEDFPKAAGKTGKTGKKQTSKIEI